MSAELIPGSFSSILPGLASLLVLTVLNAAASAFLKEIRLLPIAHPSFVANENHFGNACNLSRAVLREAISLLIATEN
ncbi:hypothetical protein [uncultured Martelella sp.]|uniref:hypothetical protein n=1 Tax=uncultured Martelella sp. TaxID=392331 RepID=UPI0029C95DC1|nr:hypothetical protein [uncultured Martelella sp.]